MKSYVAVTFEVDDIIEREVLSYHLGELGAESIEEREDALVGYFEEFVWEGVKNHVLLSSTNFTVEAIQNQNWNAIWEASFQPVLINDFCYVRAPFHNKHTDAKVIDIILEPKMAFGTAHHETTYMMMSAMEALNLVGKHVFDFGCGTAILSILAEKLGAGEIYSIDIEENAVENAVYNAEINACSNITCEQAVLEEIDRKKYDLILANINRSVLLDSAPKLPDYLADEGLLLLSGILISDLDLVTETYTDAGFLLVDKHEKGEWACLKYQKITSP